MKFIRNKINKNGHYQTLYTFLKQRKSSLKFDSTRIMTEDNDFLDLFWHKQNSKKLIILTHGLEGHAKQPYMTGMANTFAKDGNDIISWNLRSCSKEINLQKSMYHGGSIDDLHSVITHAKKNQKYDSITLIGFSLGGNITLCYLGNTKIEIAPEISSAVAISAPCDLKASTLKLDRKSNFIYSHFFLKQMMKKIKRKSKVLEKNNKFYPKKIKTLNKFNDLITADLHGFNNANDYYESCSSKNYIKNIKVPVLILNALNDPFLEGDCYPYKQVNDNPLVLLETPKHGGHVGFYDHMKKEYVSEIRSAQFAKSFN